MAVNKQRQHGKQEVSRLATEIVARWRDVINKSKPTKKGNSSPTKSPSKASTPKKSKSPEVTVPLDQRTWKTDNVDIKRTGTELRDNAIGLIYNGLACNSDESK